MENIGLPQNPVFKGVGFDFEKDSERLSKAMKRVFKAMYDQGWYTLAEISKAAECPEASASAHLRALRNPENGGFCVEHRRRAGKPGVFEYRIDFSKPSNLGAPSHRRARPGVQPPGTGPQVVLADKVDRLEQFATFLYQAAKRYPASRSGFSGYAITPLEMSEMDKMAKELGIENRHKESKK